MYKTQHLLKRRVKKSILLLFAAILFPVLLFADAANIIFTAGGNVKPMNSESIKMVKEKINITMRGNHFEVRVDYVFHNSGEKQTAIMGFPNSRGTYGDPEDLKYGINDFRAFDGERELKIERKGSAVTKTIKAFPVWETFTVDFEAGETKMITNIYSQEYFSEYGRSVGAEYILTTGATWKGSIDSISVNIYSNLSSHEFNNKTVYIVEGDKGGDYQSYYKDEYRLYIYPQEYIIEDNVIKMMFTDVEPDFNIYITLPPGSLYSASSVLDEDKNDKYTVGNLTDGDPSTAWVEGKKGSGINEYIMFYCPPPPEDSDMINIYSAYKIDSLGIISGYAKNESVFYNNNRVKKIRIEYKNDIFREENPYNMKAPEIYEYILKDTMDMQYLVFPEPIFMSSMKISILEVNKGSKWDDTCISELRIFSSE